MERGDRAAIDVYRNEYLTGIDALIDSRYAELAALRSRAITPERLAAQHELYRSELINLYGWPLTEYSPHRSPALRRLAGLPTHRACACTRIRIEALPGVWLYGLLFEPVSPGRHPLVIMQHGGGGTPELCCDLDGMNNYNQLGARLVERDAVVFAPQLLLWNAGADIPTSPHCEPAYNRTLLDAKLKQLGGGIIALELACLRRCIDALSALGSVESDRIGIAGLSYGGMYALLLAAVEPRISAAYSVCYFCDEYQFADMYTRGLATRFTNAELAALIAPRALCIEVGQHDTVLPPGDSAYADYQRASEFYAAQHVPDRIKFILSEQGHKPSLSAVGIDFLFKHLT